MLSAILLTFNSERVIEDTIRAAKKVSEDIQVVDSHSTDNTVHIATEMGAKVTLRPFRDYADQRNWAIENLALRHDWQMHLDADEVLSDGLIAEIRAIFENGAPPEIDGFLVPRLVRFLGRDLRHGGFYPTYHARIFRSGCGRVEDRRYDQHFLLTGKSTKLRNPMIDDHRMSLSEWTARHNRWSDLEIEDLGSIAGAVITPRLGGNAIEQARYRKSLYYRLPLFVRPMMLFGYRYFLRLGFLDGVPGLIYCFLQAGWYRFLVDAKLYEQRRRR